MTRVLSFFLRRKGDCRLLPLLTLTLLVTVVAACGGEQNTETTAAPPPDTSRVDTMTVDRVLRTDDRFSTLTAGLDSTGLDSILATDGPYTLFAPPNAAFEALPEGTVPVLFTERPDRLRTILAHHIVERRVPLTTITDTTTLITLTGDSLRIFPTDSTHTVGNAQLLDDNIETANGLIHVIDTVLRPPETETDGP